MSKQSIAAYQRFTGKVPPVHERLRDQAGQLRRRAAALLAQSNDLEAMAAELDPPKALIDYAPNCDCGETLVFDPPNTTDERVCCYCLNCKIRSNFVPGLTFCYGYGRDKATALADWRQRMDSM